MSIKKVKEMKESIFNREETTPRTAIQTFNEFASNVEDYVVKHAVKGDTGEKGPKGDVGPIGERGERGPVGDRGDTGPRGEQGVKGEQGDKGATGLTGLQGPKGNNGNQGPKGLDGKSFTILGSVENSGQLPSTGNTGDAYLVGLVYPRDLYLWDSNKNIWFNEGALRGMKGEKGEQGEQGPEGIQGPRGNDGPKGEQGVQGEQGPIGDVGPKGDTGPRGDTGERGADGERGEKGEKGEQGPRGFRGNDGVDGTVNTTFFDGEVDLYELISSNPDMLPIVIYPTTPQTTMDNGFNGGIKPIIMMMIIQGTDFPNMFSVYYYENVNANTILKSVAVVSNKMLLNGKGYYTYNVV